jgi:hypothetical protein
MVGMMLTMKQVLNMDEGDDGEWSKVLKAKVCIGVFAFTGEGAIVCTVGFRVDSHTLKQKQLSSATSND